MRTDHLLIIRFSALGDVAMTVPVVYSLAKQYPELRITVLSRGFARTFFEFMPSNVGFMEVDFKKENRGIKGLNKLYRRLTAKHFTAVADLHGVLRSEYLSLRFRIDRCKVAVIDKHRKGKRHLVAMSDKQLHQQPTSFRNYADVLARLGYPVKIEFGSLYDIVKADITTLPSVLNCPREHNEVRIGIAPFAAHEGKIYPLRLMEKVIASLLERHTSYKIYLFGGGKSEMAVFNEWQSRFERCICASSYAGGMRGELTFMSTLDIMISMDSANMHLASLVGIPVVSIWGATHPYAGFMGWGQSIDNAIQIDLPCRPCSIYGNKPCMRGDYACLKNISPEQIVEKVEAVIRLNKKAE
ncbi:MAG: glycosyltransferase family 9 protein [Paraprevotella sp.]|nr:glycosyltransferase family 9 protein [Paraprevotella sp.]